MKLASRVAQVSSSSCKILYRCRRNMLQAMLDPLGRLGESLFCIYCMTIMHSGLKYEVCNLLAWYIQTWEVNSMPPIIHFHYSRPTLVDVCC